MSKLRTKIIELDGEPVRVSQLSVGPFIEIAEDAEKIGGSVPGMLRLASRVLAQSMSLAEPSDQAVSVEVVAARFSPRAVLTAYSEVVKYSLEDVPKVDQGKAPSP